MDTIQEAIDKINYQLLVDYANGVDTNFYRLKELLRIEGFPMNFSVGSKHEVVTIGDYLTIRARRKRATIGGSWSRRNAMVYVGLEVTNSKVNTCTNTIKSVCDRHREDERIVVNTNVETTNKKIDKLFDLIDELGISTDELNSILKAANDVTTRVSLGVSSGSLRNREDYYLKKA